MPTNPLAAGSTHAHSTGWGVTDDRSGVRHEKSRAEQTSSMVNQPYTPVQRMKPRTAEQTTAHLLIKPDAVTQNLKSMREKIKEMKNPSGPKKHSLQSNVQRALATVLAVPDAGDVTGNMQKALATKMAPKKLVKKSLQVPDPTPAYSATPQNEALLSLHRNLKDVRHMTKGVADMIALFKQAQDDGNAMRRNAKLPADQRKYRDALLAAHGQDPDGPRQMLQEASRKCDEIAAEIKKTERQIEVLVIESEEDGAPPATSPAGAKLAAKISAHRALLDGLKNSLQEPKMQREVSIGVVATLTRNPPTIELEKLQEELVGFEGQCKDKIANAEQALQQAHKAEIDKLFEQLPLLDHFADKDAVRAFIREGLGEVKLDGTYDVTGKETPPPMVMQVFMRALAGITDRIPGRPLDSNRLDRAMLEAVHNEIKSLTGGVAMYEQIIGEKIAAGTPRIAHRVDALAQSNLERLKAANVSAEPQARQKVLSKASEAARKLSGGKGKVTLDQLGENERASFRAVRNDFFTSKDTHTGIDRNMQACNDYLVKLQTEMIDNTKTKGKGVARALKDAITVLSDKTPLGEKALDLASLTSTLGYDDESRPQARLDLSLKAATDHIRSLVSDEALDEVAENETSDKALASLGKSVASIAAASLPADQLLRLAGIVTAEKIAKRSVEKLRPGHVTLEAKDTNAFKTELDKLRRLHKPGEGTIDDAAVDAFIRDHGSRVANPYALVDLVDALQPHIPATKQDGEDNKVRQQLLTEINVIRHLVSAEAITSIKSPKDLYLFLDIMLHQLELRGKLKMSGGGNVGVSSKSLTWPLDLDQGTLSLVLPIRPVSGGNKIRCAVFEFGFSTYAMEMLVGSENRRIYNAGAGAGVRVGFPPFLSSGGGVDRNITYERSDTKGLWMRVPRGKEDNTARSEMRKALQTLLGVDEHGDPVDGANHLLGHLSDEDGTVLMPKLMGKLLAENENLSLSAIGTMREESTRHESTPNASLLTIAGGSGDDASRIQVGAAGVRSDRRTKSFRQEDKTGFLKVTRANNFSGGSVWEQESIFAINGLYDVSQESNVSENMGALNRQKQHQEKGVDVKMRHIEVDGETHAVNTRIDIEDTNFDNHAKRVEGLKHDIVGLGVEQLFAGDKNAPGAYEQHYVAADMLNQRLEQSGDKSASNSRHVHAISFRMEDSAARRKDAFNAMTELERRYGFNSQAEYYKRQGNDVLQHPQATKPWKVTTSERTSENRQLGWSTGVTVAGLWKTEGQRGTSSFPK
ncbi:hypothetical protein [Herbaspirillum sp. YR522]|uniref:hypothetical protein n=1 Tax=Herbaspirillum sp. YR522 TaxID=1144342 RepID=UPI00026FBC0D|nr:hypothetical protein [Herbaspirillum sp. YR522]EJN07743.1 hypothetical protein PMI40_01742 [Herbaspirillum sp. YR522]